MSKLSLLVVVFALAAFATGCGKVSDAEKKDVSKVVTGLVKQFGSAAMMNQVNVEGRIDGFFNEQGRFSDLAYVFPADTCTTLNSSMSSAGTGMGCTFSCTDTTAALWGFSCALPTTSAVMCGSTQYQISGGSFSINFDFGNTDFVAKTGTLGMNFTFAANVNGGNISNKKVECNLKLTADYATVHSGASYTPTIDCTNFSCKFDGSDISCADLQAQQDSCST